MAKKNIYEARDRRGVHWFKRKPSYDTGHSVFRGSDELDKLPADRKSYRLIKRFWVTGTGQMVDHGIYPNKLRVVPIIDIQRKQSKGRS